ncbi:MAG: ribosome assembly cofactor RimP [Bacteroidales bacterium]|jgi:ribosome maturation factor RimP|nr:ribosome assembly cofactor RimP [Bacteroidales bacterium]
MIDRNHIAEIVREYIRETDYFLVDVRVSSTSRITVLFDRMQGGLMVEDCVKLSRYLEGRLDRDREDFELQVSSPGLEMPFLVHGQYIKNQGRKVEVTDTEGNMVTGLLRNVTEGGFELTTEVKRKGKEVEIKELSFNFDQVNKVKSVIEFK